MSSVLHRESTPSRITRLAGAVLQGRETAWLFSAEEGLQSLRASARAARLVVVRLYLRLCCAWQARTSPKLPLPTAVKSLVEKAPTTDLHRRPPVSSVTPLPHAGGARPRTPLRVRQGGPGGALPHCPPARSGGCSRDREGHSLHDRSGRRRPARAGGAGWDRHVRGNDRGGCGYCGGVRDADVQAAGLRGQPVTHPGARDVFGRENSSRTCTVRQGRLIGP